MVGLRAEGFGGRGAGRGLPGGAPAKPVAEARAAVAAGADVIVAQGAEAGGHRGAFNAVEAESRQVGLIALLPAIVNAVDVPVFATGGIGAARGRAASFVLGASAAPDSTGFFRAPAAENTPGPAGA